MEVLGLFLLEDRAPATRDTYRKVLMGVIDFLGPKRPVDQVTREDILRYVEYLRNKKERYQGHPRRETEEGGLSPKTVEKRVRTLVTFFHWMVDRGYLEHSPAARLKLRRYQRPPGSTKAATPEELRAILEIAEAKARLGRKKYLAIFLFLCDTGCRAGEAASVLVGSLDMRQMGAWVLGKGDKVRPVFFGPRTATVIQEWLEQHPNPVPNALLFNMTPDALSQVIYRMSKSAGLDRPVHAHAIRHRVGQVWSAAKLGEQATQLKLGHDDPSVTIEMYYNTTFSHIQQASRELSLASIFGLPTEPVSLMPPMPMPVWLKQGNGDPKDECSKGPGDKLEPVETRRFEQEENANRFKKDD